MFDDVEDVILADGNFEKRSIHNKMYLLFPQVLSNGPAKSRFYSSLGSKKRVKIANLCGRYDAFYILTSLGALCAVNPVEVNLSVYMRPPNILCQVFHTELARVRFV